MQLISRKVWKRMEDWRLARWMESRGTPGNRRLRLRQRDILYQQRSRKAFRTKSSYQEKAQYIQGSSYGCLWEGILSSRSRSCSPTFPLKWSFSFAMIVLLRSVAFCNLLCARKSSQPGFRILGFCSQWCIRRVLFMFSPPRRFGHEFRPSS